MEDAIILSANRRLEDYFSPVDRTLAAVGIISSAVDSTPACEGVVLSVSVNAAAARGDNLIRLNSDTLVRDYANFGTVVMSDDEDNIVDAGVDNGALALQSDGDGGAMLIDIDSGDLVGTVEMVVDAEVGASVVVAEVDLMVLHTDVESDLMILDDDYEVPDLDIFRAAAMEVVADVHVSEDIAVDDVNDLIVMVGNNDLSALNYAADDCMRDDADMHVSAVTDVQTVALNGTNGYTEKCALEAARVGVG
jgi:hypothetical protein